MMEEKLFLEMKKAISNKEHFVLETPLSHIANTELSKELSSMMVC
jgi:hypothetical protein